MYQYLFYRIKLGTDSSSIFVMAEIIQALAGDFHIKG
jgi:hypothetical protein